jgi:hypothetical protein
MYSIEQSNLVSAYGGFFAQWPWDHYATLTFGRQMSETRGIYLWGDFIDSIGRLTHGRVGWVRADEQRWSGCGSPEIPLHFHSLLKYQHVPAPEAVAALWKSKAGDAKVEVYRSGGGAGYYIAKMFPHEDTRYDLGGLEYSPPSPESHGSRVQ